MADFAEAIIAKADAHGLGGLLGTPPRLRPQLAEERVTEPYAVYTIITSAPSHTMTADQNVWATVQFDCFGGSTEEARDVAAQIVACFDRWAGVFAGVTVRATICDNRGRDTGYDEVTDRWGHMAEFRMFYGL